MGAASSDWASEAEDSESCSVPVSKTSSHSSNKRKEEAQNKTITLPNEAKSGKSESDDCWSALYSPVAGRDPIPTTDMQGIHQTHHTVDENGQEIDCSYEDVWADFEKTANQVCSEYGMGAEYLDLLLKTAKDQSQLPVAVSVCGQSGVGKSSLINALRGVMHDDADAAPTDVTECTVEPQVYRHSGSLLAYWDNPGFVGIEAVQRGDIALIVTATRFKPSDAEMVRYCIANKKPFIVVRTKTDLDIENDKRSKPKLWKAGSRDADTVLHQIRQNMHRNLLDLGVTDLDCNRRVFLVNSQSGLARYDLPDLQQHIKDSLPNAKAMEFLRVAPCISAALVEQKRQLFKQESFWTTFWCFIGGAQPIPGIGLSINMGWMFWWRKELALAFGFDHWSIHRTMENFAAEGVDPGDIPKTAARVVGLFLNCAGLTAIEAATLYSGVKFVPVVGFAVGGVANRELMRTTVLAMIDEAADVGLQIQEAITSAIRRDMNGIHLFTIHSAEPGVKDAQTKLYWFAMDDGLLFVRSMGLRKDGAEIPPLRLKFIRSPVSGCIKMACYGDCRLGVCCRAGTLLLRPFDDTKEASCKVSCRESTDGEYSCAQPSAQRAQRVQEDASSDFDFRRHAVSPEEASWVFEAASQPGSFVARDDEGVLVLQPLGANSFLDNQMNSPCMKWMIEDPEVGTPIRTHQLIS